MKTIGAKQLRAHLDEILDRVLAGEDVVVKHRFKQPVRLAPANLEDTPLTPLAGLRAFDEAPKNPSPYDRQASIKQLYRESIEEKYTS